ncbi:hypothetical protein GCM10027093_63390 [Paraburkholderia jirisanensis]
MPRFDATEQIGVNAVQGICLNELGWIFREQPVIDMGIDAQIELVQEGNPTGKLVAVQIKTGPSHVRETDSAYVFRGRLTHLDYWTNHSLPVLLILHLPEATGTFWVHVDGDHITRTGKSWTIEIPKANRFGVASMHALSAVFDGSPAQQRMRRLAINEPLMRHIKGGGKVSIELEHWINKGLGRSPVQVYVYDDDGNETLQQDWGVTYTGYKPKALAEALFPWAVAYVDEDFYEQNEDEEDADAAFLRVSAIADGYYPPQRDPKDVYPYTNSGGEVDHYRLQLFLNSLGEAYLVMAKYLATGG